MNNNGHQRRHFDFGDFRLYPQERLLTKNEDRIALTPRILDLLIVLVEHDGELVSKKTLLETVWSDSFVEEGNLSRTISTLRKSLGLQANGSDFIETVPKLGYRFIAPVTTSDVVGERLSEAAPSRNWLPISVIAVICLVVAAGAYFLLGSRQPLNMTVDGTLDLTNNPAEDTMPSWSPDGKQIAFQSNRDGPDDIYVMAADGSGVRRLTNSPADDRSPTWSPDGRRILFETDRDGNRELYVMAADGSDQTRLTFSPNVDGGPAKFSPDGRQIAFARNMSPESYNFDILVMNADGTDIRQLTFDKEFDAEPLWSLDGKKIYFLSGRTGNFDIWSVNTDGSGEQIVAATPTNDLPFAFTPDGGILYSFGDAPEKFAYGQIFVMGPGGEGRRQLTSFSERILRADYSAAAGKFAVVARHAGSLEICTMNAPPPIN